MSVTKLLTAEELVELNEYLNGSSDYEDFWSSDLCRKLYDYYLPEMPHGIAKARTGDPDMWILDRVEIELSRK